MQIHVARHSQQLGIFSGEEITAGLQSGRFVAGDLAWREGLAAWTPLGDWPEFRAVGVPASPAAAGMAEPVASQIPWEQGKSLGSFFATLKASIANPSILATGRFAFGDWLTFCYLALLISVPFQLINLTVNGDINAKIGEFLGTIHHPEIAKFAEQLAKTPPTPVWVSAFGTLVGLAFAPLMYAFFALFHWVGQRIFQLKVPVERTVAAALLATALLVVLMAPFQLLGFSFGLQMAVSALVIIPACMVYYRAFGAATGVSPWVQFGISCFVWFILCCCCCLIPVMAFAGTMGAAFAR